MEEHTLEIDYGISPKECLEKDSTKTDMNDDPSYYPKEYTVINVAEDDSPKDSSKDSSQDLSNDSSQDLSNDLSQDS
jgi:hypothetical protein